MTAPVTVTALAVLTAAALVSAQVPSFGWCPEHLTKTNFDMERYMGTWYEVERYVSVLEAGTRCVRTIYTKAKDGRILVDNVLQNRLTGVQRVLKGEIRSIPEGAESKLKVKFSSLRYPFETSYTVLDTDYDSYSVVWSCFRLGLFNTQNAWIMTREENPPVTTLQKAYAVLDRFKISRTFFVKIDQTKCQIAEPVDENDLVDVEEGEAQKTEEAEPAKPEAKQPIVGDDARKEGAEAMVESKPKAEKAPNQATKPKKTTSKNQ